MATDSAESHPRVEGGMPAAPSPTGGGFHRCRGKQGDVSEGHADCTRSTDGSTEPGTTPAQSLPRTVREFERALAQMGFSRRQARAIAARGFKASADAEASNDASELATLLKRHLEVLERTNHRDTGSHL